MTDEELARTVRAGERRGIGRALSRVEAEPGGALAALLYRDTGRALVVGVTGAPGVGKSSLVDGFVAAARAEGRSVGVVAVDPSSPYSGGALLGDRVRMERHLGDPGVFVRSLATRGASGGLAQAAADAVRVLDAAGFDLVLLETTGAGQAEVAVADECHTTVVVLGPGAGDDVQAEKAGILEIADLLVVNKADLPGADRTVAQLREALALGPTPTEPGWTVPVLAAVATEGRGVDAVWTAIGEHMARLGPAGRRRREERRAAAELRRQLWARLVAPLRGELALTGAAQEAVARLVARETDPRSAVDWLLAEQAGRPGRSGAAGTPGTPAASHHPPVGRLPATARAH